MEVNGYQSIGERLFLKDVSREALPSVLTIIDGIKEDGLTNFYIKSVVKNSRPIIYEIKDGKVRVFYFVEDGEVNITNVTNSKQKNKTEDFDIEKAIKRRDAMRRDPKIHKKRL